MTVRIFLFLGTLCHGSVTDSKGLWLNFHSHLFVGTVRAGQHRERLVVRT